MGEGGGETRKETGIVEATVFNATQQTLNVLRTSKCKGHGQRIKKEVATDKWG